MLERTFANTVLASREVFINEELFVVVLNLNVNVAWFQIILLLQLGGGLFLTFFLLPLL